MALFLVLCEKFILMALQLIRRCRQLISYPHGSGAKDENRNQTRT